MFQRSSLTALWPSQAGHLGRNQRTRPQQTILAIALIVGVTLVLCLYLYQTSRITVTEYTITSLQSEYQRLQRENANLLAQYAEAQSLRQMDERALKAGYGPASDVRYVEISPFMPTPDAPLVAQGDNALRSAPFTRDGHSPTQQAP
ncbi:MAG: hypothetical protein GXP42_11280 [Chloroflexi bacterium]|nr:hypothetical protein [Chloroflexota bacterium]